MRILTRANHRPQAIYRPAAKAMSSSRTTGLLVANEAELGLDSTICACR